MLDRLFGWIPGARVRATNVAGSVVVGGNNGLIYVMHGSGPPPAPPALPWADLPAAGAPFEAFNLLTWKCRLARDLVGRATELATLRTWAESGPKLRLRFLVGPGGAGKTRLAAELADALQGAHWHAGFAALDRETSLPLSQRGLLIILDYPEAAPDAVRSLLREAARATAPAAPVRLLLLSRRPLSDWTDDIVQTGANTLCDAQEVGIGPLEESAAVALFRAVAGRLAAHRGRAVPPADDAAVAAWLRRRPELHTLPLLTTAAAIHFIDEPTDTLGLEAEAIVTALVDRERDRADRAGTARSWGTRAASRLVGLAALRDGLDAAALRRLAAPALEIGLPNPANVVDEMRALGWWSGECLPTPQPDIVAAELLHQVLADAGDRGAEWVWATLAEPDAVQPELIGRRMHDLAVLHGAAEKSLAECLIAAVAGRPERAEAWRAFTYSIGAGFRVSPVAVAVGHALLANKTLVDEVRAILLNNLSVDLAESGDGVGALVASREAVAICRRLVQVSPARFEPDLARSLTNLAVDLAESKDVAGALAASCEAVMMHRRQAQANPTRFEPDLALNLNNLSNRLADSGDGAGALAAICEAVAISRRLVQVSPVRFEPDLARHLNNLSDRLVKSGDRAGALAAIRETVAVSRRLAQVNPACFEPDLARSLDTLSNRLAESDDGASALAASRKAVAIHHRLAQAKPARFEPDLALSLNNLSSRLAYSGDQTGALAAIREAVAIRRCLAQKYPTRFEPDLALSLNNLSGRLGDSGDEPGALAASREAAAILRRVGDATQAQLGQNLT